MALEERLVLARQTVLTRSPDEQGWLGYLLIYGLESHEALERYLASPARERFWRELEPLGDVQRAERFYGTVDLRLEAASSS